MSRHSTLPPALRLPALLLLLLATACGAGQSPGTSDDVGGLPALDNVPVPDGSGPPVPPSGGGGTPTGLVGGVLATVVHGGETYRVWVTNPGTAQALVDIGSGSLAFTMITGPIRSGSGQEQHNAPWSWHLDPEFVLVNVNLFRAVFSGPPSQVEANLAALLAANESLMTGNGAGTITKVEDFRLRPAEVPTVR